MQKLRIGAAVALIAVWVIAVVLSYVGGAQMPPGAVPAMLLAAGWLFGRSAVEAWRGGKGDD